MTYPADAPTQVEPRRCAVVVHDARRRIPLVRCDAPAVEEHDGVWLCLEHVRRSRMGRPPAAPHMPCAATYQDGTPCRARASKMRDGRPVCTRHFRFPLPTDRS